MDAAGSTQAANTAGEELLAAIARTRAEELCRCIAQREAAEWLLAGDEMGRHWQVRVTPFIAAEGGCLLLEGRDISAEAALRGEVASLRQTGADLQAAHEELLCAYEVIETNQDVSRNAGEAQAMEAAQLLRSNFELLSANREMAKRLRTTGSRD